MVENENGGEGILFAKKLAHSGLPSSTLVKRNTSILGASSGEASALSAKYVHKFFLC